MSYEMGCGPDSLGIRTEAPAGAAGELVSQRVPYLLIFASFLQFLHVHHTACLHLKGIILTRLRRNIYVTGKSS